MIQHKLQYVHILPVRHTDARAESPADPLRLLRWMIAGLMFLAMFLVSLRPVGWV